MEMNIAMSGFELWKGMGGFANIPHIHDEWYQVTMPVQGTCHLVQERCEYNLSAGSGLLVHPRMEHSFHVGLDAAVIVIKFRRHLLQTDELGMGGIEFRPEQIFDPREISSLFRFWATRLLEDLTEPLVMQETEVAVQLYINRILTGNHQGQATKTSLLGRIAQTGSMADTHIIRVLDYVHSAYQGTIDIDSMAAIAHQSRYHFMRSFKAATGSTPYQYVLRLRVEEAARRLRKSHDSVTDISFGLGFASVSQFYRAFVRLQGMTPSEYRTSGNRSSVGEDVDKTHQL